MSKTADNKTRISGIFPEIALNPAWASLLVSQIAGFERRDGQSTYIHLHGSNPSMVYNQQSFAKTLAAFDIVGFDEYLYVPFKES